MKLKCSKLSLAQVILQLVAQSYLAASELVIGVLQPDPVRASEMATAGVSQVVVSVAWDQWNPAPNQFDRNYCNQLRSELEAYRRAGLKPVLDLGVQYPPKWLRDLPNARYQNQYGDRFIDPQPGMNVVNSVFNAEVRAHQADYIASLFRELGTDWVAVRLGGGWYGELNYPRAVFANQTNCYWAYGPIAQGRIAGLPAGMHSSPVPGWKPGEASHANESARRFIHWYFDCLKNYHDWQIQTVRGHYTGPLQMLYPSWGIRDGQIEAAIANDLKGGTPPEKNGEFSRGFDFARFIAGIHDTRVWVHCTWLDSNPEWSDNDHADSARWDPSKFLQSLASSHQPPLNMSAENTGGGGMEAIRLCAERIHSSHIQAIYWAFGSDLFDGMAPELKDLVPELGKR